MTTKTKQKEMSTAVAFEIIERFLEVLLHRVSKRGYQHYNSNERHQDIQFAAQLSRILKGWQNGEEPDPVQALQAGGIRLPLVSVVGHRRTVSDDWGIRNVETDGEAWRTDSGKLRFSYSNDFPESEIHRLGIALHTIAHSHD
jgi:hypothetical protein